MIENIIHTVSKEAKPSQYGSLQTANTKGESGLGEQFKALFHSFNKESENTGDATANQEPLDESVETEAEMNESSEAGKENNSDSEALKNIELEKLIDQKSADQKTESAQNTSDPVKITVSDESISETETTRTNAGGDSIKMEEVNITVSGDQELLSSRSPEGNNGHAENQDLTGEITGTKEDGKIDHSENVRILVDAKSAPDNSHSEKGSAGDFYSESTSEITAQLSDSGLNMGKNSFVQAEAESKADVSDKKSALKAQIQNGTLPTNETVESISFGNENPDQAEGDENPILKQELSDSRTEKSVPQDSNTILKSATGDGTVLQANGASNEVISPAGSKEPVLPSNETEPVSSNEMEPVSSNENDSSAELRSSEVQAQRSQFGDVILENVQSTGRAPMNENVLTTLNNSEVGQNSSSAERIVDRVINENIEKPIRISQKPVESTVLIQDKVQPKKERNDVMFLNNNESKESSRLAFPGIGLDASKQSSSYNSGQFSENFDGLSEQEKNEILWKEHTAGLTESDELNRSELSAAALSKLGDSTLSNHYLRRVMLPGLTQAVFTASGQSDRAESWQRHNFMLEDGSKIQLSARKVEGVLQIKLGATIGELSKLLQLHQDEIREHLEKECNIKIDLQFDQGSGDQDQSSLDNFFGESTKKPAFGGGSEAGKQVDKNIKKQLHTIVTRNFGYNSKEWTA